MTESTRPPRPSLRSVCAVAPLSAAVSLPMGIGLAPLLLPWVRSSGMVAVFQADPFDAATVVAGRAGNGRGDREHRCRANAGRWTFHPTRSGHRAGSALAQRLQQRQAALIAGKPDTRRSASDA